MLATRLPSVFMPGPVLIKLENSFNLTTFKSRVGKVHILFRA